MQSQAQRHAKHATLGANPPTILFHRKINYPSSFSNVSIYNTVLVKAKGIEEFYVRTQRQDSELVPSVPIRCGVFKGNDR